MKRILKWAGIVFASLAGLLVIAIGWAFMASQRMLDRTYSKEPSAVHASGTPDQLALAEQLISAWPIALRINVPGSLRFCGAALSPG